MARDTASLRAARAGERRRSRAGARDDEGNGELARPIANGAPTDARATSTASSRNRTCAPPVTSLDWRDGRAHVVLAAVSYDALIGALEALQRDARLRAVEATLTARVEPGIVRAELTLAR